jgi:predicted AAA+ superfamily ATPase
MLFKRKILSKLLDHSDRNEYIIVTGARQVGKTTILKQLYEHAKKTNGHNFFLTFEDYQVLQHLNIHPEKIFDIIKVRPADNGRINLFIDEIQYLDDPSNFLKYHYDVYGSGLKIITTGSSAFYLDKKFNDSLAGRKMLIELYTLEFDEFLDFKMQPELKQDWYDIIANKELIPHRIEHLKNLFNEYLIYGGYPAVVLETSFDLKQQLLNELVRTYLKRDVHESNISNEFKFYDILKILAANSGTMLNIHELSKVIGLSSPTVESYINILRKCFHIHLVRPFYRNTKKELSKMPKVYFNDLGFRNMLLNNFQQINERADKGALIENYCFIRLRQLYDTDNINFWRNKEKIEIDFIVSEMYNKGQAIEVKYNQSEFNEGKYKSFVNQYPDYALKCIAYITNKTDNEIIRL